MFMICQVNWLSKWEVARSRTEGSSTALYLNVHELLRSLHDLTRIVFEGSTMAAAQDSADCLAQEPPHILTTATKGSGNCLDAFTTEP